MESCADVFAADGPRLFVFVAFHEIDPPRRFIVRGKADIDGLNLQIAAKLIEDFLSVEVAPDRFAVGIRSVSVLKGNRSGKRFQRMTQSVLRCGL